MTIQSQTGKAAYVADGNTTAFNIPFYFFDNQVSVYINDSLTPLVLGTDYTLTNNQGYNGGEVVLSTAPQSGTRVTIVRNVELTQLITFLEGENFPASDFEYALDKIVMALQQIRDRLELCLSLPNGSTWPTSEIYQMLDNVRQYQEAIASIPNLLTEISTLESQFPIDLSNYYTKSEVDTAISNAKCNKYTNVTALAANTTADNTYASYPYRLSISLENVTSSQIPTVNLGLTEALSGNIAPIAQSYNGGIYLYLKSAPQADFTIPSIIMH